jgi:hypothetical protein
MSSISNCFEKKLEDALSVETDNVPSNFPGFQPLWLQKNHGLGFFDPQTCF